MKRHELYKQAKNLAAKLNKPLEPLKKHWKNSTSRYWTEKIEEYTQQIHQRNTIIDEAIENNNFQTAINYIINNKMDLSNNKSKRLLSRIMQDGRYQMKIKGPGYEQLIPINNKTKRFILSVLKDKAIESRLETFGSDVLDNIKINEIEEITLDKLQEPERQFDRDGGFFAYVNTSPLDLSRYQIYNEQQISNKNMIAKREHCLINCFQQQGVPTALINNIKLSHEAGANISQSDLKSIAERIKRNIILCKPHAGKINKKTIKAKEADGADIQIALYKNHYFTYEETNTTKYAVINMDRVINFNNWQKISKIVKVKNKEYAQYGRTSNVNSLLMVVTLDRMNKFKKMDMSHFDENAHSPLTRDEIYLDNIENEQRLYTIAKSNVNSVNHGNVFYADTEAFVHDREKEHELYLIGVVGEANDNVTAFNVCDDENRQKTVNKFLYHMLANAQTQSNIICYFHNLKYDITLLEKYLNIQSYTIKDGQYYNCTLRFKGVHIELRDSYKLLAFPLSKFQKIFNLKYDKAEAIAYNYYTPENNNQRIKTSEYARYLSKENKKIFRENIKNDPSYSKGTFNPLEYYKSYLVLDCLVLKKGLNAFKNHITEITKSDEIPKGLNIHNYLTISTIADRYLYYRGCFDNVYEQCGNLRAYISKAVYGGRVHANTKFVKQVIEGKQSDFDAVSLYPSAMHRLSKEIGGVATGPCSRFKQDELHTWENKDYCIITISLKKINKKQQMPMIAIKSDDSINYVNEFEETELIVDKYTLQDYIKFHEIEYDIIDGIYWNNGFNNKIGQVMEELHEERKKQKEKENPIEQTIKLIMNSAYGKTIMKKTKTKTTIVKTHKYKKEGDKWIKLPNVNYENYIYNNFNTITSTRKINDGTWQIDQIRCDNSYNRGHVGCAILSISKRIMNEVFDIANTENFNLYYTDTDSIHIDLKNVNKLNIAYFLKHKKQLIGKELGQFHTDFKLKGAVTEVYATKTLILGKKSYIDKLEAKDKNGNTISGYHVRLKGITEEGLKHEAKKYKKDGEWGLFLDLAQGKKKKLLLNPFNEEENDKKECWMYKSGKVSFRGDFERVVQF